MSRIVLRGADVIDGSGAEAARRDVVLSGGSIEAVVRPGAPADGAQPVDLTGLTLTPGFIDAHSHADNGAFLDTADTAKLDQGVTTEITGNCGFSFAPKDPLRAEDLYGLTERIFPPMEFPWNSFEEYIGHVERSGPVTNCASMIGHNTLRIAAMGAENRAPDPEELDVMCRLLREGLSAGALGLSSGLIYPPGIFSDAEELRTLVRCLPRGAVYASHMRNEGRMVLRSIEETLAAVAGTGARAHVSHIKISDRHHWGDMPELLRRLDRSTLQGTEVTQDLYPYTAASTMLSALLPPWMQAGGRGDLLQRLTSESCYEAARADILADEPEFENFARGAGWHGIVVSSTASGRYEGATVEEIARDTSEDPVRTVFRILREEDLRATMVIHAMSEADVTTALAHPRTMIGSDGLPNGVGGRPHPRGYGTFVRVLTEYAGPGAPLSLPEAVRRMTSLTAETFGLPARGRIGPGFAADLVALDLAALTDHATFADPVSRPSGVEAVWVNGTPVIADGRYHGQRAGRFLRAPHRAASSAGADPNTTIGRRIQV